MSQIDNNHKDNSQGKVCYGLVQYEDEDRLAADPGLVDGGDGGDDDHQVEDSLGNELDDGDNLCVSPHKATH